MPAPQIIAGPAIVQHNGHTYYTEGDITVAHARETFLVRCANAGTIDERMVSQMSTVSFKPMSVLDTVAKYLPYLASQIGVLLIDQADPNDVVVWARDGVKTTWGAGFVSRLPSFNLSAIQVPIQEMELVVLGNPTKDIVDADAWNIVASASFAGPGYDESLIKTPRYLAEWGDYEDIESEAGFIVEPVMTFRLIPLANWGNVNALLTDLVIGCRFVPASLDEEEIHALMGLQGADALLPGESLAKADDDLVIAGGGVSFTLHKAGPKSSTLRYGLEPLRQGEVAFVTRKTWTGGAVDPLFTIAFS